MKAVATAYVPDLNKDVYVATLKRHKVLLNEEQSVIAKDCTSCGNMYTLNEFYKDKYNLFNRTFTCKYCRAKVGKKFREQNPRYYRRYLLENREKALEESRKWYRNNPDRAALYYSRHAEKRQQSLEQSLPEDKQYIEQIHQVKKCVITGVTEELALDHVMPIAVGYWGNSKGNLMWLYSRLNTSKGSANVFQWMEEMEQERLDYLLPESVTMTIEEFKEKLLLALTAKAEELDLSLEQYKQKYNEEYFGSGVEI